MTVYNFYIYDKHCECLYYTEWTRRKKAQMVDEEEKKLVYGMVFSLKNMTEKLSLSGQPNDQMIAYRTSAYKMHLYETPSGFKFILNTDPNVGNMRETLRQIYAQIFVEFVVRNPLSTSEGKIDNELFTKNLDRFIRSLTIFV